MEYIASFLYWIGITLVVALTSIGVGLGGGRAGQAVVESMYRQPGASADLYKASFISLALVETAGIFSLVMALLLIFTIKQITLAGSMAVLGIACALGISGFLSGIYAASPAQAAFKSITRQPFFAPRIINLMLLCQSLLQTPVIFGLVIALLITKSIPNAESFAEGAQLLASGMCLGLGCIGSTIGLGRFTAQCCTMAGFNRAAYSKILPFTLISGAIIETPLIFALIIALILSQTAFEHTLLDTMIPIMSALCMGIGAIAAGLASARTATEACIEIGKNPGNASLISKVSIVAQALIDAIAIYALLISLLMIFLR